MFKNVSRCVHCGKELDYVGVCAPTMCDDCGRKFVEGHMTSSIPGTIMDNNVYNPIEKDSVFVGSLECLICGGNVPVTAGEMERKKALICGRCRDTLLAIMEKFSKGEL